jgi:adenosylmethionine-8-amino-7-oxononanoate aminotransferase
MAIWPDFLCLSKGISGGYLPLSLVMTRDDIYQAFYDADVTARFLHSHSYTGNPLACRAALATLAIFDEDDVHRIKNRVRAERISAALAPLAAHPQVEHFRQRGMIWAFDAVMMPRPQLHFLAPFLRSPRWNMSCCCVPSDNTVYLMPPYILDDEEIDALAAGTKTVFDKIMAG